ncbi:MAG: stage 0 sporulation family protein [Aquificae bacterium]|nr:stage 0 sporulation family protein [Aquificota bacterium]
MEYLKVRYLDTNKIGTVEGVALPLKKHQKIVVEDEEKGEDIVEVLGYSKDPPANNLRPRFVRVATRRDESQFRKNMEESRKAFYICKEKIEKHGLEMHLLKAYVPLNRKKIFFYYLAEERVDFRALVRDLAKVFRRRIEMRQIGVRDAVQMKGWVGRCMRETCCSIFAESFQSISLKDITEQNLPLSPSKFTGPCGRLVCCMAFERENYLLKVLFPEVGSTICYNGQEVKLLEVDPIRELVVIEYPDSGKKVELGVRDLLPKDYEKALEHCKRCGYCCRREHYEEATEHEIATSSQE